MGENDNIPQMTPSFENICRKDENGNTRVEVYIPVRMEDYILVQAGDYTLARVGDCTQDTI